MPELPEVEITRRGIAPHVLGQTVSRIVVRQPRLRWPVPDDLPEKLCRQQIRSVERRGKYLLMGANSGTVILHLGMSGSLRVTSPETPPKRHDHVDMVFESGICLRFHDPRRFGCLLWTERDPYEHALLVHLGPEPFAASFSGDYLHAAASGRTASVKSFIMDSQLVVGIGNIYANEALFRAGIAPRRAAGRISRRRYERLAQAIRAVLREAIAQGGTTLRDFVNEAGNPGYFQQTLNVYGREGLPCRLCGEPIQSIRQGQRTTFYCRRCQH
jgi:formamidopyrimidine-DNA glycosylase